MLPTRSLAAITGRECYKLLLKDVSELPGLGLIGNTFNLIINGPVL